MTKPERIELLKAMHIVMLTCADNDCYDDWTITGVPDEPTEKDFDNIAKDKEEFRNVVERFCWLVNDFF